MRRVVILALLALALPLVASAGTIDIVNKNGGIGVTYSGGSVGTITSNQSQLQKFNNTYAAPHQSLGSVFFKTGVCLTGCATADFVAGTGTTFSDVGSSFVITCKQAACGGNHPLFSGAFVGPITWTLDSTSTKSNLVYDLTGTIAGMSNGHYVTGTTTQVIYSVAGQLTNGIGHIRFGDTKLVVPEPGTLGLLGTGLVGIAGMFRRKILGA
jgi:hypothetical protein